MNHNWRRWLNRMRLINAVFLESSGGGVFFFEFEGGATGAVEGFAVIHYCSKEFHFFVLAFTNYGKITVFRDRLDVAKFGLAIARLRSAAETYCEYSKRTFTWDSSKYHCYTREYGPPEE